MRVLNKFRRPLLWRWNHCFHFTPGFRLPDDSLAVKNGYELLFPCAIGAVGPHMFAGGESEFNALKQRVGSGDLLGVIIHHGRVVHRSLVQTAGKAAMEGDGRAITLSPGRYYIHWCETIAEQSGKGLYTSMLRSILRHFSQEEGFAEAIICCRQDNVASIRGILRSGFAYAKSSLAISLFSGVVSFSVWYQSPRPPSDLKAIPHA